MERRTLESKLVRIGYVTKKRGEKIPFRTVLVALMGDKEAETIRNLKADADRKEREAKIEAGELVPMADIEPWLLQHYIVPMAGILSSAPTTLDTRCNPEHPEVARKAIADWIEGTVKPSIREGLEKPKHRKSK
jgi:hypothetical protein